MSDRAYLDRWMQGFLQRRSLDEALRHAKEQHDLDTSPDGRKFWSQVLARVGFLKRAETKMQKRKNPPRGKKAARRLTVPEQHQLRIARDTLKMNDAMARVMGGPSKEEARKIIESLTGQRPREENPRRDMTVFDKKWLAIARSVLKTKGSHVSGMPRSEAKEVIKQFGTRKEARAIIEGREENPRRPGDDSGWGPGSGYESAGKIKTVAQLKKVATELLKYVHPSSVMASAANSALRSPDFFMARPSSQEELLDMHRRYVTPERKGRYANPRRRGTKKLVLRVRRGVRTLKGKKSRRGANPPIAILGNPPADSKYLGKVSYIEYTHGHDGQPYYHHFKPPVFAQVMNDGRVVLWHPTNNLWKLFPVPK